MEKLSDDQIKKVTEYYTIDLKNGGLYINGVFIPFTETDIILGFGRSREDIEQNRDEYVASGGIFLTSGVVLYQHFFNLTDEEICYKTHHYGLRTKKYLDACRENIGLIECGSDWDGVEFEKEYGIKLWGNLTGSGEIDCGKWKEGWVAQYVIRTGIDDYTINWYYLRRKPTKKMILDLYLIEEIEGFFLLKGEEAFTCWECGCKVKHWLDLEGGLKEKFAKLTDSYCGC